jgi:catechol 2,3-dioxygenase-like lactoylglutathione lyase family enzyme
MTAVTRFGITAVTLVVRDYDEAIAWYTKALGFELLEDTPMDAGKRWVKVAPRGYETGGGALLLARAGNPAQEAAIGAQTGGRVAFFLHTDDFARDFASLTAMGARFVGAARDEPYGRVVVFEDLYGNRWDLIQPTPGGST